MKIRVLRPRYHCTTLLPPSAICGSCAYLPSALAGLIYTAFQLLFWGVSVIESLCSGCHSHTCVLCNCASSTMVRSLFVSSRVMWCEMATISGLQSIKADIKHVFSPMLHKESNSAIRRAGTSLKSYLAMFSRSWLPHPVQQDEKEEPRAEKSATVYIVLSLQPTISPP